MPQGFSVAGVTPTTGITVNTSHLRDRSGFVSQSLKLAYGTANSRSADSCDLVAFGRAAFAFSP